MQPLTGLTELGGLPYQKETNQKEVVVKHFVLVTSADEPDGPFGLPLEDATLKEAKAHIDNRTIYPDPTAWKFRLFRGTELPIEFRAVVKIKK